MAAYIDLFTPETWQAFIRNGAAVTGFRKYWFTTQVAAKIKSGDVFICYLVGLSRWIGALKAISEAYEDATPYFVESNDPFVVRFNVENIVTLSPELAIPITAIWNKLPRCSGVSPQAKGW